MMKLIGSLNSPYVRKTRIVMAEKKIECELVLENVWASDSKIHSFNPLGKVPCLILDDGEAVFDSRVICEYVDTLTPVGKLLPQERRERTEVRCWEALADGMLDAAVLIRLETTQREEGQRNEAWVARQQRKIDDGLKAMSKGLAAKNWREEYANLDKHVQRLSQRQSFIDTLPA